MDGTGSFVLSPGENSRGNIHPDYVYSSDRPFQVGGGLVSNEKGFAKAAVGVGLFAIVAALGASALIAIFRREPRNKRGHNKSPTRDHDRSQ